jgi:hypothetical protein
MICPRCMEQTSAFSTRCPHCTSEHGILELWLINFLAWVFALGVIFILGLMLL